MPLKIKFLFMAIDSNKFTVLILFPVFLILYEFSINMSNDMYLPALPIIAKDLEVKINLIQLTITTWLAGSATMQLILGPISDRHGRRLVIFVGGVTFLVSTIICAITRQISTLLIARFFEGMAVSSLIVAGYSSIHELFNDKKAVHILSWMGAAAVLAPMLGPIFGGYVLLFSTWRMIFVILFLLALVSLTGLWLVMPESNINPDRDKLGIKKILRIYFNIFTNKSYLTSALPIGLLYSGIVIWITASPSIIIEQFKISPQNFGYTQAPIFLSYIVGATILKFFIGKIKIIKLGLIGSTISLISGILLVISSFLFPSSAIPIITMMCFYTAGVGFANAPLTRTAINASSEKMGAATAFFYLKMSGLGAIGSFIVSVVYDETIPPVGEIILVVVVIAWCINLYRIINYRKSKDLY